MGRHIIGRDSRIFGGLSMVAGYPVLIVVSEEDGRLTELYLELEYRLMVQRVSRTMDLLNEVYRTTRETLRYNYAATRRIKREFSPKGAEVEVPLSLYVDRRVGVCWQQGLLAAYLIERLIDGRYIEGKVSTDRNTKPSWFRRTWSGHQWCRYTAPDGTVYILDPAQGFCGKLADVPRGWGFWRDYFRPEDPRPPIKDPLIIIDGLDWFVAVAVVVWSYWYCFL